MPRVQNSCQSGKHHPHRRTQGERRDDGVTEYIGQCCRCLILWVGLDPDPGPAAASFDNECNETFLHGMPGDDTGFDFEAWAKENPDALAVL